MDYRKVHFLFHYTAYYLAWVIGVATAAKGLGTVSVAFVLLITSIQVLWQFKIDHRTLGLWQKTRK